jgi:hypothetical protein
VRSIGRFRTIPSVRLLWAIVRAFERKIEVDSAAERGERNNRPGRLPDVLGLDRPELLRPHACTMRAAGIIAPLLVLAMCAPVSAQVDDSGGGGEVQGT